MFNSRFGVGVLKHPGYNVGGGIGEAALIGAAIGGGTSLATGQDVLEGALLGGLSGGAMSGVSSALGIGKAAAGTAAAGATGQAAKAAVTPAITNAVNAGVNLTDDVVAQSLNSGISTAAANPLTSTSLSNIASGADDVLGSQVRNLADSGKYLSGELVPATTAQSGIRGFFTEPGLDLRTTALAPEGSTIREGLDFYARQGDLGKAAIAGAAGYGIGSLQPRPIPELPKKEKSKLAGYDPDNFEAYIPDQPNPYYSAKYAEGGITSLAQGGMGGNMGYPQGRLDTTQYATPSQMPTSAQEVNSTYETPTDPYMGSPLKMAEGGIASYAPGGQVYYDPQKGQYYTQGANYGGNLMGTMMHGMGNSFGGMGDERQYIGADGRPAEGVPGGKMGADMASQMESGSGKYGGGNIGNNFKTTEVRPEVYQQAQQAPMAEYNPNAAMPTAMPTAAPSYDSMMQGATPQDFNRTFSQITNQTPYAPPTPEEKPMASGGIAGYNLGGYASGGNPRLLKGPGDGMSDNIPATIGNRQPARLADGEFVVPADVVSHLGNGSTDAGAKHLYNMMDKVRTARTGKKAQGKQIKPQKYMPA